jgi:hypothetical protein
MFSTKNTQWTDLIDLINKCHELGAKYTSTYTLVYLINNIIHSDQILIKIKKTNEVCKVPPDEIKQYAFTQLCIETRLAQQILSHIQEELRSGIKPDYV